MATKKTIEQIENERKTAEVTGLYAENVASQTTKQKFLEAISTIRSANTQKKSDGVSPFLVFSLLVLVIIGVTALLDRKKTKDVTRSI
jgi:hypothetical protein